MKKVSFELKGIKISLIIDLACINHIILQSFAFCFVLLSHCLDEYHFEW